MSDTERAMDLPVHKNMRENPPMVRVSEPVTRVVEEMLSEDIGAIIVVNKNGDPLGIITEKDMIERVVEPDRDIDTTLAQEVMSAPLISIEEDRSTGEALDLMRENNIRRLAVVRGNTLKGIVTERRLLETVFKGI
ncbi:MAG: cyclic nucleotide-binding/CBS domain-containing protein [Candidatus Bathyarchaeia archaeon]